MIEYFSNFQNNKINITSPDLLNALVLFQFFIIALLTIKKDPTSKISFFSYNQTEQLKGIAILFVIIGHLWVHVSSTRPCLVFSGDAVSIFLILSGFGLAISSVSKEIDLKTFIKKRINRVMLPYWIATITLLCLDYFFLNKYLKIKDVIMTFLGLNFTTELRVLDYVRWFVTFLLFWYSIFYIVNRLKNKLHKISLFLLVSFFMLPLNYYLFHFGWYQFFSFPVGYTIGVYYESFKYKWNNNRALILSISIIFFIISICYKFLFSNAHINSILLSKIPNIIIVYVNDAISVIFSIGICFIFLSISNKGYKSKFLLFLGRYSYELFLLHGAFLIKYNPFIYDASAIRIFFGFTIFFVFISILAISLSTTSQFINSKLLRG